VDALAVQTAPRDGRPSLPEGWAVEVEDLTAAIPLEQSGATARPAVRGLRLRVGNEAVAAGMAYASAALGRISRSRVEELLDQLSASPWLRHFRWYYAALFRLAGVENGLDVVGTLAPGAVVVQARFRAAPERTLLGHLRDLAKGAVEVRVRIEPSVGDGGRLRLRLELEPDVRGAVAKLVVGSLAKRPGVIVVDQATVEVDLGLLLAQTNRLPFDWEAGVQDVEVTAEAIEARFGPTQTRSAWITTS
jgi:hypothetical protein